MGSLTVKTYPFSQEGNECCRIEDKGKDWPVVYLINNDSEIYIGETSNLYNRFKQHRENPARHKLKTVNVIYDDEFNKSAILDIEQYLIQYIGADNKFKLQNLNGGQSSRHNYYQRAKYLDKLDLIWNRLSAKGLTNHSLLDIRNENLFKFSPYTTLTQEQNIVCNGIMENILDSLKTGKEGTAVIEGSVGTGKTVVLINLIYKIVNASRFNIDPDDDLDYDNESLKLLMELKKQIIRLGRELKIAFVVPMDSIRTTISKVFQASKSGLKSSLVMGPLDISREHFDIVFVDEAHRLPRYKNIMYREAYIKACSRLGLDYETSTTLDMIMRNSQFRVLVYDGDQRVKETDITPEQFADTICKGPVYNHALDTQMRCKGGQPYIHYIENILSAENNLEFKEIQNYDFLLYDDVGKMVDRIKELDAKYGLCRTVAGYSWKWISKGEKSYQAVLDKGLQDIDIEGNKFVWNMCNREFLLSENAVNEIGCIHTTQGYDINYVGVIFGPEIDYDFASEKITIDISKFYDSNVKNGAGEKDVKTYILNAYRTLMGRGIRGCFIYACNPNFRKYLSKFIKSAADSDTDS